MWKKLVFDKNIVLLQYINFKNTPIMILTTTPTIEGHSIKEYKGIVASRAVFGANAFKDMFAGIRDIVGGRVNSYEKVFMKAQETAMENISQEAMQRGANAIVGIHIDYENIGSMLMVAVSGTAVTI